MTLCIAWKNGDCTRFASDSRISIDDTHYADIGIKVMEIPVKIKTPVSSETNTDELVYDHKLGMCYCGDVVTAHLIKEAIAEALQKLVALPSYTDFSLNGICNVIGKFFENTSDQLRDGFGWSSDIEFLIGGFCPERGKVLTYKFEIVDHATHYKAIWNEVLINNDDSTLMGSGKDKAEEIINLNNVQPGNKLLKVLRDVCKDNTVPSVGGFLQYGQFDNNNFRILGIADYKIDGNALEYIYAYRGTVLYKGKFESDEFDYHIAGNFITPFEDEIDAHFKNGGI